MPQALRNVRNNHTKPAIHLGYNHGIDAPIRFTINKIVVIASISLALPLIENPAPPERVGKKFLNVIIGGFAQVFLVAASLDVIADDHNRPQRSVIAGFHGIHKLAGGFEWRGCRQSSSNSPAPSIRLQKCR